MSVRPHEAPAPVVGRFRVRLFAAARDRTGTDAIEVELPHGATVGSLRQAIAAAAPQLAPLLPYTTIAVDGDYAADTKTLQPGQEVALIPPVSGG